MESLEVRSRLVEVLKRDLVGPASDDELLTMDPKLFYLTGFLVPRGAPVEVLESPEEDEEMESGDSDDDGTTEQAPRKAFLPSSMGLSVLIPKTAQYVEVTASWGQYTSEPVPQAEREAAEKKRRRVRPRWRRVAVERTIRLTLPPSGRVEEELVPGVKIMAVVRPIDGARAAGVFLVNERPIEEGTASPASFLFQAQLGIALAAGFVPRPDARGRRGADEEDERIGELQYRDVFEYAVGHGVSVEATLVEGKCTEVCTAWMPSSAVEKVIPSQVENLQLQMEVLAEERDAEVLATMLRPLPTGYEGWLAKQSRTQVGQHQRVVLDRLLADGEAVRRRIADGIEALSQADVREAFQIANRAMARAQRQRNPKLAPEWRPFQLAFVLMNLRGMDQPDHVDRKCVDLLYFPTGGGKTEAYLGLAAFTLALRRLRNPGLTGAGLSVVMRYTLRLLTLDQLERATQLICAMELERRERKERGDASLGDWPFEIGLWVGKKVTPNRMRSERYDDTTAEFLVQAYARDSSKPRPVPVERCPWCSSDATSTDVRFDISADRSTLLVKCLGRDCPFSGGLPAVYVDEAIYRRLPCFLIATVDKFASLPWEGQTATLFGKVDRHDRGGFYGACRPGVGERFGTDGLPPPDLIVQDELHLITGPLGTMVGVYEMAIDLLARGRKEGKEWGPKIIASTATVRRASSQIHALFGRSESTIFPPPGPDRRDSFFARTVPASERPPRLYVGVAAPGRSIKVAMLRTYLALLGGAQRLYTEGGGPAPNNPADPYMTLLGYFNSLRELGGARRIVEDEVVSRALAYGERARVGQKTVDFASRSVVEPVELTSRESTASISKSKARLNVPLSARPDKKSKRAQRDLPAPIDVALATNMISVGLDIQRLGLMVVLGQPKMTSEYIQTTSRVGRDDRRPGLVVTILNPHKARDRSHYERFDAYHASFYRGVEATSVTPFAPPAIKRGFKAIVLALARLEQEELTADDHAIAMRRPAVYDSVSQMPARLAARAGAAVVAAKHEDLVAEQASTSASVRRQAAAFLRAWKSYAESITADRGAISYTGEAGMLHGPLELQTASTDRNRPWVTARRSLRDVEPSVDVYLWSPTGEPMEDE